MRMKPGAVGELAPVSPIMAMRRSLVKECVQCVCIKTEELFCLSWREL